ncbi:MAG: 2-dehydropantoate 2-reductase [bacterium]|nr:2-dehydropantoate 2-reductase [bacterium]
MKILVLGAGAIGSVFGGFLAKSGCKVTLVGRPLHMRAVRKQGLKITGIWGEHIVKDLALCTNMEELVKSKEGSFDLVLVCVKSYDTKKIVEEYLPVIKNSPYVISFQNGLGNSEIIINSAGEEKTITGRVIFGVNVVEPGEVKVTVYADKVILGSLNNIIKIEEIEEIADLISNSGIPCQASKEINKYLWAKVLYNSCLNSLASLLEVTYGELGEKEETKKLMLDICKEIFLVAKAKGVELFWEKPEEYFDYLINKQIPLTKAHYASMLQDIRNKKKTEIDSLNGAVVKFAKKRGLIVPVNEILTRLIKSKESMY